MNEYELIPLALLLAPKVAFLAYIKAAAAAITVAQGLYSMYQGSKQAKYGNQQRNLSIQQAQENLALTQQMNAARSRSANAAASAMAGAAAAEAAAMHHAAAQAQALAETNAQNIESQGAQSVRQKKLEHGQIEGSAIARQGASGVKSTSSSLKAFNKALKKENQGEVSYIEKTFANQASVARQQGDIQAGELHAAASGAGAGAMAAQLQAQGVQSANMAATLAAQQGLAQASLPYDSSGSTSSMFSGLGNIAQGVSGIYSFGSGKKWW